MNSSSEDPFYTQLQDGEYERLRPQGRPCDAAIRDGCSGPQLSMVGKIVMGVIVGVVGLVVVGLLAMYVMALRKGHGGGNNDLDLGK